MQAVRSSARSAKERSPTLVGRGLLQRCKGAACRPGSCAHDGGSSRARGWQHDGPAVPRIVSEVLSFPGQALDPRTQASMQSAFGHDFSRVRIHTNERAAESAEAVGALAYTVGRDVVFGGGRYDPRARDGVRLLAHELVHVVQQGATSWRPHATASGGEPASPAKAREGEPRDAFELEADRLAEQVVSGAVPATPALRSASGPQAQPEKPGLLTGQLRPPPPRPAILPGSIPEAFVLPDIPEPPRLELTGPLSGTPARPRLPSLVGQLTGPPPVTPMRIVVVPRCVPGRPLTWADFPSPQPANAQFGARTDMQISPATVQGNPMFQLTLSASSRVKARYRNPANRATNGCASPVTACRNFMNANPGGSWGFNPPANNPCPSSILPSTPPQATTVAECDTVIGAECDRAAQAESSRLLAHEQRHFDIACVLVNKANDALRAGMPTATVATALNTAFPAQTAAYDGQTDHGCIAAAQAQWDADVVARLPAVTIP
jgi:uncharacterized protein DUF4157